MDICILDFETFWSSTHSLSKMSPIAYVMHPETEIISMAAKFIRDGKPGDTQVIFGEENIKNVCSRIDWSDMWVVGHNLEGFDSMLCAWRLGIKPKMWGCTLAMARPHHAKEAGGSLAKLVAHYDIGNKDQTALMATKGRHLKDFTPEEVAAMGEYNKADVDQCYELFKRLLKKTSKDELRLIDMTIRMLVEPKFEVDTELLESTLVKAKTDKAAMLRDIAEQIGVNTAILQDDDAIIENASKILASSAKFSELLRSRNVEVPTKISPTTGKEAPALAKTDEGFIALQDHPDPVVSCAAQARLGVKSTLLESRIQAFLDAATAVSGRLPVPLKYSGADTTRRWCLAEGTPVLVRDMNGVDFEVPIEQVTLDYEVWDGVEWVNHHGVEFSGDKEVITWDGVNATPEHIVWVDADKKVTLGYACANGLTLWRGNDIPDIQADISVRQMVHRLNETDCEGALG